MKTETLPQWMSPVVVEHGAAGDAERGNIDRTAAVVRLAPLSPKCFSSRSSWIEYLQTAVTIQRERHEAGPLVLRRGQPPAFNREFFPCVDCNAKHAHAMALAGRCEPNYLMTLPAPHIQPPTLEDDQC